MSDYTSREEYEQACQREQQKYGRELPRTSDFGDSMPSRGYCIAYVLIPIIALIAGYFLHQ